MRQLWTSAAILAAACVSFDPAGPPVPDIAGTYTGTAVIRLANTFESRTDTLTIELTLRNTGYRGGITGTYHVAMGDTGPFGGTMLTNGSLTVFVFGEPPKPIAGIAAVRNRYPWCDFTRLGIGPMPGTFRGDSLFVDGQGSLPCFYGVGGGFLVTVHTEVFLHLSAS